MKTLQEAQKTLSAVREEIADIESQYASAGRGLGSLLARFRSGEKKAGTEAGKASMQWATLDTQLAKLRLEESALVDQVRRMEEAQRTRAALETIPAFESINDEARELERQFAELIQSAAEVGQQLRSIRQAWQVAKQAANAAGGMFDIDPPRYPNHLLRSGIIDNPEKRVNLWLGPSQARWMRENARKPHVPVFKVVPGDTNHGADRVIARYSSADAGGRGHVA